MHIRADNINGIKQFGGLGNRRLPVTLAIAAGFALTPLSVAQSHPHVWIEATSQLQVNADGKVNALSVRWQFDEFFSSTSVQGLDANKDGIYQPSELAGIAKKYVDGLKDFKYYTQIKVNGKVVKTLTALNPGARHDKGLFSLEFTVPLAEPVDVKTKELAFSYFDASFYISIEPALKATVAIPEPLARTCEYKVGKSLSESEDAASVEKIITNMTNAEGLGELYAVPVAISCAQETVKK